jgi:SAM-dependent methyltransferase
MKKLYIHAGFPKCGSSSIQTFLSNQGNFYAKDGNKLLYAALLGNNIVYGHSLREMAMNNPVGYISSIPWRTRQNSIEEYFETVGEQLLNLLMNNHVILSQEAWIEEYSFWKKINLFEKNEIEVNFICYIRPQIEWVNSGWWQWGAWSNFSLDDWINSIMHGIKFGDRIDEFKNIKWIKQIHVRLLTRNLISDFSKLLDLNTTNNVDEASNLIVNKGLPNGMLRLFQLHRELRPGPHDSNIDTVLTRHLQLNGKPAWVLNETQISRIIRETQQSNKKLIQLLDEDCRTDFEADLRYWDAAAFSSFSINAPTEVKPTYEELEEISLAAINTVVEMNGKISKQIFTTSDTTQSLSTKLQSLATNKRFRIIEIKNQPEWNKFAISNECKQERWTEGNLFVKPPVQFLGFCGICSEWKQLKLTANNSTITPDGGIHFAYSETCVCEECNTNSRMRAAIEILEALGASTTSAIYLTEQATNLFKVLSKKFSNLIGSENLGNAVALGKQNKNGYRNENLQALTFENFSFDFVLSLDVLKHVANPFLAINEILRVLKPGGIAVITFPFQPNLNVSIKRAELQTVDGVTKIKHLKPPLYNPSVINPKEGSLVFYDLGFDILEHAISIATEAKLISYWSYRSGHFGPHRFALVLQK